MTPYVTTTNNTTTTTNNNNITTTRINGLTINKSFDKYDDHDDDDDDDDATTKSNATILIEADSIILNGDHHDIEEQGGIRLHDHINNQEQNNNNSNSNSNSNSNNNNNDDDSYEDETSLCDTLIMISAFTCACFVIGVILFSIFWWYYGFKYMVR